MTIDKATRHQMSRTFGTAFMMFGIVVMPFWWRSPDWWPSMLAVIVLAPALLALFPLLIPWGRERGRREQEARARWREQYRRSPEANLLNLHD